MRWILAHHEDDTMEIAVGLFRAHGDVLHFESIFFQTAWPPVAAQPAVVGVDKEGGMFREKWLPVINGQIRVTA